MKNKLTKVIFLDSDLATLLSNIGETRLTAVQCTIFIQTIDYLIRKQPGRKKKSILLTIPPLHAEWFPFWSYSATKRILQRLRCLGILKTKIEYKKIADKIPEHATRIWVQEKRIVELAEQIKAQKEGQALKVMAKRLNREK